MKIQCLGLPDGCERIFVCDGVLHAGRHVGCQIDQRSRHGDAGVPRQALGEIEHLHHRARGEGVYHGARGRFDFRRRLPHLPARDLPDFLL